MKLFKSATFFILLVLVSVILPSCNGEDLGGGKWILAALTGIGTLFFGYKAYLSYDSGATDGGKNVVPWGYIVFTLVCLIGFILIVTGALE